MPDIAVVATEEDPRLESVYEAVDFWNNTFTEIGSPFRLGSITQISKDVDIEEMRRISSAVLKGKYQHDLPDSVETIPGDVIIVLSKGRFVSFVAQSKFTGKVLVGIRCYDDPLILPNVTRNLIAHELGHAIGLGHNSDPTKLMCGRPAACRPDDFQSDEPMFFPLTEYEKEKLLELYPGGWANQR